MKRAVLPLGVSLALLAAGSAAAVLTPTRSVTAPASVTAISVTGRSVAYAVGQTRTSCGSVVLWSAPAGVRRAFGSRTILGCEEGPSGGFGIPSVAVTGTRTFWLTRIGGNITDWQLWTATPTRPAARRLAFASSSTDGPAAIVLGRGTPDGVPYAVGHTLTFIAPSGRRLFRTTVDSEVRLLASGIGPGATRVVAALADGRVVLFSGTGVPVRTDEHAPGDVRAVALGPAGALVQVGSTVNVGPAGTTVALPAGGLMLDQRQGRVVYRTGTQVRARRIATGEDTLLRVIRVKPWQPMPFSTGTGGSAWADGRSVSWRPGPPG